MTKHVVSIIIPVYNVSDYVEECLQSVAAQTYTAIECIIVDDCGTDDSMQKVEHFVADYQGPIAFKILHHEHNRGLSAARNTGMDAATGEYIYFIDSDDYIYPHSIAVLVKAIEQEPVLIGFEEIMTALKKSPLYTILKRESTLMCFFYDIMVC